jgi:predicted nucleotidyltransferase
MNLPQFDQALNDLRRLLPVKATRFAILFGSVARGEATEDSDIDLLVSPRAQSDEETILEVVRRVERDCHVRIACVIVDPDLNDIDRQLLDTVLREGHVLIGEMPRVGVQDLDLESVRLVTFDLRALPNAKKARLSRELYGFETRKRYKGKTYVRRVRGRLEEWGGRKIGRGTVLVPEKVVREIDRLLRSYGAKRMLIPLWIQRA